MSDPTFEQVQAGAKLAVALLALAEQGIPADIQELLVRGNSSWGVKPGALRAALDAAQEATGSYTFTCKNTKCPLGGAKLDVLGDPRKCVHLGPAPTGLSR